jgi:hypothetical protein
MAEERFVHGFNVLLKKRRLMVCAIWMLGLKGNLRQYFLLMLTIIVQRLSKIKMEDNTF